ncbi:hypothetical protein F2Q69_00059968 [Brassica cretica]|uniref:Uncharacterized protein n=1 Tax=Brassica cretica TaxID=69181 RepID=A0A8S9RJ11_BRACR|nr:hypothetical protein F2Q69_00059968 [Brassica cretica]
MAMAASIDACSRKLYGQIPLKMQRSCGRSDTDASTATNGAESTTMNAHTDEQDEVKIES